MTTRTHLLSDDEVYDLRMALDVLCGCYSSGVNGPEVQAILKRYEAGKPDGIRARTLFNHLSKIGKIQISRISAT